MAKDYSEDQLIQRSAAELMEIQKVEQKAMTQPLTRGNSLSM